RFEAPQHFSPPPQSFAAPRERFSAPPERFAPPQNFAQPERAPAQRFTAEDRFLAPHFAAPERHAEPPTSLPRVQRPAAGGFALGKPASPGREAPARDRFYVPPSNPGRAPGRPVQLPSGTTVFPRPGQGLSIQHRNADGSQTVVRAQPGRGVIGY